MKIGILQTGRAAETLCQNYGDFPAMFERLLNGHGFTFRHYAAVDGILPDGVTDCDGWLVTGSRHSANDDLPWIALLEDFLHRTFAAGVPIVGVCFGHQILAQALGGKVERFAGGWGIGPMQYEFADGTMAVLNAWHQDQVTVLPKGATRLATSSFCRNAALAYDNRALSYQAHPEFTNDFTRDLLAMRVDQLPRNLTDSAGIALKHLTPSPHIAQQIVQFFRNRTIVTAP